MLSFKDCKLTKILVEGRGLKQSSNHNSKRTLNSSTFTVKLFKNAGDPFLHNKLERKCRELKKVVFAAITKCQYSKAPIYPPYCTNFEYKIEYLVF